MENIFETALLFSKFSKSEPLSNFPFTVVGHDMEYGFGPLIQSYHILSFLYMAYKPSTYPTM